MKRALLLALALGPAALGADVGGSPPTVDARVDALLAQMTLEEKAGQLTQIAAASLPGHVLGDVSGYELLKSGRIGSVLNATNANETNFLQRMAVEDSRLHIPLLFGLDVIHGYRTIFPIPLGLSASWDPDLIEATARFAACETAAEGIRWTFSPMVDIARDPRWGRIAEGAGEDPFLGAEIARAYVRGYQGDGLGEPDSILACAKHFVGYGAAEGGREYNTTEISQRTLRDVYLPPFHAAAEAGVATFMAAFNALDGVPSSANPFTLSTILRGEWHFPGFVVSDWTSVRELMLHGIANDGATAARKSFLAGVDMDMQSALFLAHLPALVRSGAVPEARVDDAVRRILRLKFELGLFDHPYVADPGAPFPPIAEAGNALARRAAEESFVLLKNDPVGEAPLLPLPAAKGLKIALIGPLADSAEDMLGCWTCQGRANDVVTLRRSLVERAARKGMTVLYAPGADVGGAGDGGFGDAIAAAQQADVVILAVGERGHMSGEAESRSDLGLPGSQEALVEAVAATQKPVVLVVFSGRPLALPWEAAHVPAILMAWFPGVQAGPALVNTLFGDVAPSGRLTASMPWSVGQVPIYYNALNTGRPDSDGIGLGLQAADEHYVTGYSDAPDTALYSFGQGLTYTSFSFSPTEVSATRIGVRDLAAGATLRVSATVRNTGARAGVAVPQLYIRWRGTSVALPVRELKGFRRVPLRPGESARVEFTLGEHELAFWGLDEREEVEPASLYVWIGPSPIEGMPVAVSVGP